ncbi:MAG: hypothetical protein KC619_28955, partial [Myxococcales bacterium]|nr:hypothetical protein [Myxococcales bacterium]
TPGDGNLGSITVEYTDSELDVLSPNPTHDGTISETVHLAGDQTTTYQRDGSTSADDTSGTFTGPGDLTWTTAELGNAGKEAKRDYDWTTRSPNPIKANHDTGTQCKGASAPKIGPDESYFNRRARKTGSGYEIYTSKGARFTETVSEDALDLRDCDEQGNEQQSPNPAELDIDYQHDVPEGTAPSFDPENEAAVGVKQRLRLMVPNVYTQLTLGEALSNADSDGYNYPGFGVQTGGHVFISAGTTNASGANDPGKKFMVLQAKDGASVASPDGPVFIAGKGGVNVAAEGGVTMAGEGGVVIGGGNFWGILAGFASDFDGRHHATDNPTPPNWAEVQGQFVSFISAVCAATDVYVGLRGAKLQHTRKTKLGLTKDAYSGWGGASGFGKAGIVASTLGAVGGLLGAAGSGWPSSGVSGALAGTTIYGQSGLILQSFLTMGMYSLGGTAIGTKDSMALVAAKGITIDANKELAMTGEDVSLLGQASVEVIAGGGASLVSRTSMASLIGANISIGSTGGEKTQSKTERVDIVGEDASMVFTKTVEIGGDTSVTINGRDVYLTGAECTTTMSGPVNISGYHVLANAKDKIALAVGNGAVIVEDDKVSVGWYDKGNRPQGKIDAAHAEERKLQGMIKDLGDEIMNKRARAIMVGRKVPKCTKQENRLKTLEGKLKGVKEYAAELRSSHCKNALFVKSSGIQIYHDGYKFDLKPGKGKHCNTLEIKK